MDVTSMHTRLQEEKRRECWRGGASFGKREYGFNWNLFLDFQTSPAPGVEVSALGLVNLIEV